MLLGIYRKYRNFRRLQKILQVFAKYGFGQILDSLSFKISGKKAKVTRRNPAERLRLALEELGPTFIKIGQVLSTRADLLPESYIQEFTKLQDRVFPLSFSAIKKLVEDEFGQPLSSLFTFFNEQPIATASLAQVHKAKLKGYVAVKIQRPGLKELVETDLEIIADLALIAEQRMPQLRRHRISEKVEEIKNILTQEMNFLNEAANIERFRKNFENDSDVVIPKVYWEYSTPRLLTIEHIEGIKIIDIDGLKQIGIDPCDVAKKGADLILRQIFEFGFFHGDPHPGNIFVLPDGRIAPVDFGMVGSLDEKTVDLLADLLIAVVEKDSEKVVRTLGELGALDEEINSRGLREDVSRFIQAYSSFPIHKLNYKTMIEEAFVISRRYHIRLPTNLVLLAKALGTAEGIGRTLDPGFDIIEHSKPWVRKIIRHRYSFTSMLSTNLKLLREYLRFAKKFPQEFEAISRKIREGAFEIKSKQFNEFMLTWEKIVNRLVLVLIIFTISYVSSVLFTKGPQVAGIPILSGLGFLFALGLTIILIWTIARSGRI